MKKNVCKHMIKIPKKIVLLLSLFFLVILFRWFGWRLFGFVCCVHPYDLDVSDVYVTDTMVIVHGYSKENQKPDPSISFSGYKYDIYDDNMYIGLKPDYFSGFQPEFKIEISTQTSVVNNIYFTNGNHNEDVLVWNRQKDGGCFERFVKLFLFRDVISTCPVLSDVEELLQSQEHEKATVYVEELRQFQEYEKANNKFLNAIRKPERVAFGGYSRDYYAAVAQTKSGDYEWLCIRRDDSCFQIFGHPNITYYLTER